MQTAELGRRASYNNDCGWDVFPRGASRFRGQPKENFNAMANPPGL